LGFGHAADPLIRMGRSRSEQPRRSAPVPSVRSLWKFSFFHTAPGPTALEQSYCTFNELQRVNQQINNVPLAPPTPRHDFQASTRL